MSVDIKQSTEGLIEMKSKVFEGKVMDDIIQAAQVYFHHDQKYLKVEVLEQRKGLFGFGAYISARVELNIDPIEEGKKYLQQLMEDLQLSGTVTATINNKMVTFNLSSNQNGILIGKNGKTLQSFQVLTQQVVNRYAKNYLKVSIDVDGYKEKQAKRLELLAKKVAKEVIQTKIPAKLDPMNAYERRIIHQTLSKWEQIKTTSEGKEPNRYLVIEYK